VTGVVVRIAHAGEQWHSMAELRSRVNELRSLAVRYLGRLLLSESNLEAWTIGTLGTRFTLIIPSLEILQTLRDPHAAANFMSVLEASELRFAEWLRSQPDSSISR